MRMMKKEIGVTVLALAIAAAGCSSSVDSGSEPSERNALLNCYSTTASKSTEALARCGSPSIPGSAPSAPVAIAPRDLKKKVAPHPTLQWSATDSDAGDVLTYTVKFGTDPLALSVISPSGLTASKLLVPSRLLRNKKYSWQVTVRDSQGHQVAGPVWTFTTERITDSLAYKIATDQ